MISSRKDACGILGISISASDTEIKTAYRTLMKLYHPDEAGLETMESFREVKEAYDYLISGAGALPMGVRMATDSDFAVKETAAKGGSVRGVSRSSSSRYASNVSSAADYERFQKRYKQAQVEKKEAFAKKEAEFSAKMKKQDDDFKRAMEAIELIRAAWALEAWIEADKK